VYLDRLCRAAVEFDPKPTIASASTARTIKRGMKMTSGSVVWADKLGDFNRSELRYLSDHPIFFAPFPNKFKNNCIEISARFGGAVLIGA
jgi:hypothetical protein